VTVTITPNETKPVDGWMGRYRTSGTASVKVRNGPEEESGASYYNYEFEVLTERKDSGSIEVVDITTK
jgi:hypothetical protein